MKEKETIQNLVRQRLLNQCLLCPCTDSPQEIVSWMGAMQAQDYRMFPWAIGIRMQKSARQKVTEAINRHEIVCAHLNRATWQIVSSEDIHWMVRLYGERNKKLAYNYYRRDFEPSLLARCYDILQTTLEGGRSLTCEELIPLFQESGISNDKEFVKHLLRVAEADGILCGGDMKGRYHSYALLDERIPQKRLLSTEESLMLLARKYFQSHAPATWEDYRWWSGLTAGECKTGLSLIEKELDTFTLSGQTYYIHKHNRSGRMSHSLVHFLPPYDELLLGYKNRTAILAEQHEPFAHNTHGIFYPIILQGGQVVGNWNLTQKLTYNLFHEAIIPKEMEILKASERTKTFFG